jgi:succinate-semialdehyde dehydrogenase/glutarate-semialdehyde dehydrogenase
MGKQASELPFLQARSMRLSTLYDASQLLSCAHDSPVRPALHLLAQEAVQLANTTEYGLAGYFYTRDLATAWRVAERLEYGG